MKIAILIYVFQPKWVGGAEIVTYNLAKHLAAKGHEVHILTSLDKGLPAVSQENGYMVHRVARVNIHIFGTTFWWIKIIALLHKINPDVIHCQGIGISMPGLMAKSLWKVPYLIYGHGIDEYQPKWYMKPLIRLALKQANTIIALTQDMKKAMQKIYDRNISVIPNGVDLNQFSNIFREKARHDLNIKDEEEIILFVGRLSPVKGLSYLIYAMEIIHRSHPNSRLLLVGDGPERRELDNLVTTANLEDFISFAGRISNDKIPEYIVASDIFVLPSLTEGLPIVILEAMAGGLPIATSNVGGIPEVIVDKENGLLFEPRKPELIAKQISILINNGELRKRISRNNKEKIKYYSWENITDKLESIYAGINDK